MAPQLMHEKFISCNSPLINNIFLPFEAAQITQIPFPCQSQLDQFIWGASKEGEYSVKYGYHRIKHWENSTEPDSSLD